MGGPGETYFNWLCARVQRFPFPLYQDLLTMLFQTEFVWQHVKDENRAVDGLDLRGDFLRTTGLELDPIFELSGCSILEMLIAFSERAWFQTELPAQDWFWKMIENLELAEYRRVQRSDIPIIEEVLFNFVWRLYEPNGHGGIFPMRWPKEDQRSVEIWYQFCDYVAEEQLV